MKLWFFTMKRENRYGEDVAVMTGIVKAETMEEAETIVDENYGSDFCYGLIVDEIKEHIKVYCYSVNKNAFD